MTEHRSIREAWKRVSVAGRPRPDAAGSKPAAGEPSAPIGTFILSGAIFDGTLSLTGDFHIDTEFRGELETDGAITIGPKGSVVGNIRSREVVIRGAVVGNVIAARQLIIEASGKLHGDIETACLEIHRYAFFRGHTAMTQPQNVCRSDSPAPAAADAIVSPL